MKNICNREKQKCGCFHVVINETDRAFNKNVTWKKEANLCSSITFNILMLAWSLTFAKKSIYNIYSMRTREMKFSRPILNKPPTAFHTNLLPQTVNYLIPKLCCTKLTCIYEYATRTTVTKTARERRLSGNPYICEAFESDERSQAQQTQCKITVFLNFKPAAETKFSCKAHICKWQRSIVYSNTYMADTPQPILCKVILNVQDRFHHKQLLGKGASHTIHSKNNCGQQFLDMFSHTTRLLGIMSPSVFDVCSA